MKSMLPCRQAFFPNKDGAYYNKSAIDCWFHEFWDKLPEAKAVAGNPARVHDFRHGYVVHRLNQWVKGLARKACALDPEEVFAHD
jgi:integrase/recombinase XerD